MAENDITEEQFSRAENWLTEHGDYLFRYAQSRLFDQHHAEDLVQETLLTGLRKLEDFRGQSTERTWLTGILRFKILEHHRKQSREAAVDGDEIEGQILKAWFDADGHWKHNASTTGLNWKPNPRTDLDRKEFWGTLQLCIGKLPARARAVFVQRELEGNSANDVTSELGISESNLWVLLHRARNLLKHCLQTNWTNP